jgi:hypothetical protein
MFPYMLGVPLAMERPMRRERKTFSRPGKALESSGNTISFDIGGLRLTSDQIETIRANAVKAALLATNDVLKGSKPNALADFGTFSTFSTFSSAAGALPRERGEDVEDLVDKIVGGKGN